MSEQVQSVDEATPESPGTPTASDTAKTGPVSLHEQIAELDALLNEAGVNDEPNFDQQGNPQAPAPVETPQAGENPEREQPDSNGESQEEDEPVEIDYGAIPQAPILGADQEPMTIGAMKDEITERRTQAAKVERLEFDLMRQRDLVNQILANDGPLSDEQKQQFEEARQKISERNTQTILAQFPEWADPTIFQKVQPELQRVARDVGFSNQEIIELQHPAVIQLLEKVRRYEERERRGMQAVQNANTPKKQAGRKAPASNPTAKRPTINSILDKKYENPDDFFDAMDQVLG